MIYVMECDCGRVSEFMFSMNDPEKRAPCPDCGQMVTKRRYDLEGVTVRGDTVMGCQDFAHYNYAVDRWIGSRREYDEMLKRENLKPYEDHPLMAKVHEESRYMKKNATRSELPAARAEAKRLAKEAQDQIGAKAIEESMARSVTEADYADARKRAGFDE